MAFIVWEGWGVWGAKNNNILPPHPPYLPVPQSPQNLRCIRGVCQGSDWISDLIDFFQLPKNLVSFSANPRNNPVTPRPMITTTGDCTGIDVH